MNTGEQELYKIALGIAIAVVFVTLILLFCVVFIRLYFTKIKNYTKLIYQKDLDFQKALNTTIIETQEQVLNNISQDLHDDAGQQLTYINFQIENLKLDSPELAGILEPLTVSTGQLSESIRSISHSLNNQVVLQRDLLKAIESDLLRVQKNPRLSVDFMINDDARKAFNTNEKIVIYRIFQELLNNVLKHSKASALHIDIRTSPHFKMTMTDNGTGFVYSDSQLNKATLGLQGMASRAEIIGYSIAVDTAPGKGTVTTLSEQSTS
ncbi:sensor histidine kinase [Flavobacterium sp. 3HN19-14]|uniref:sensor histidine kinase n=1 Tax=Flavobacterium sp. 3HN19-14 TaxID=3448133 RepID=UPI003EE13B5E